MRRLFIKSLAIFLFFSLPVSVPALQQVKFIGEFSVGSPFGVAVDKDGRIYVTDKKGTVKVLKDGEVVLSWGGKSADKKWRLKRPAGIALYEDRVYITDSALGKVFIFSKDGEYIDSFGSKGSKAKEFDTPHGIFVYGGVVYVADTGNRRVQVFGSNGVYIGSIGTKGERIMLLNKPTDVAVDHRGYVYVVDSKSKRVQVFKPSGKHYRNFTEFKNPVAIAITEDGFFVADRGSYKVKKYDFDGNLLLSFGMKGNGRAQFRAISGIAADAEGKVFVADSKKGTLQVFASEKKTGTGMLEYSPPPTSVRWLNDIEVNAGNIFWDGQRLYAVDRGNRDSIFIIKNGEIEKVLEFKGYKLGAIAKDSDGFLWAVDLRKDRILKIDKDGNVVLHVGSSGSSEGRFSKPSGIAVSKNGMVYVADKNNGRVQVFNTSGVFVGTIGDEEDNEILKSPSSVALDKKGNVFVVDDEKCSVLKFSPDGRLVLAFGGKGSNPGLFKNPNSIALTRNEIFVLDEGNNRIQVFDHKGKFLRAFGTEGSGKGDFKEPASLAVKDGIVLMIADTGNRRIQTLEMVYTPKTPFPPKAEGGMRKITLSWVSSVEEFVEEYKVYRSEDRKTGFKEIAVVRKNSYVDEDVIPDKTYFYRISAVARHGNEGRKSRIAQAKATKYIPPAPSGLKADASDRDVTLTWQSSDKGVVAYYAVYRKVDGKFKLLGKVQSTSFLDKSVKPNTSYSYMVTAFSVDDVESKGAYVKATTLAETRPPVEMTVLEMRDIFSNIYKNYEKDGIGKIRLTNNTWQEISKLKVSFTVKEFMDFPTEVEVDIAPKQSIDVVIKAVFNNKILEVTENTPVQTEIKISYYDNEQLKTYSKSYTVNLYEKHHLTWDVRDRIATFITPRDPVVLEFARGIARQYSDMQDPLIYARAIFDALGIIGVVYLPDPTNPYQITSGKTDYVDYIQYPRETLRRKSGDCDDLVNLYSSALESIGIRTMLLDYPGHIFMMFSTDMEYVPDKDLLDEMYVVEDGRIWIPVEVTLLGSSFMKAWEEGSKKYNRWKDKGLRKVDLKEAWKDFKPATLPPSDWRAEIVERARIDREFKDELEVLKKLRIKYLSRKYLDILKEDPDNVDAIIKLGIVYAESGEKEEALNIFEKALSYDPENAAAKNNIGNIYFLQGRYSEAEEAYSEAAEIEPDDPHIWVNLARCYLKLNMKAKAKEAFSKATELNPDIPRTYRRISLKLEETLPGR
jgi:DNA-binding beta-propeller fold protein YncE/transglutaminase-like putative cysteine protease